MNQKEMVYERVIYLVDIVARMLQSWKKVLVAALAGAVLLAGYCFLSTANPEPVLVMTAKQLEEKEKKITEKEALLTTTQDTIAANENVIMELENAKKVNEAVIADTESEIQYAENYKEELMALIDIYEGVLDDVLNKDPGEENFASDMMTITMQIADVQQKVMNTEVNILEMNQNIQILKTENETSIPNKIEEVIEQNKELQEENEVMLQEIEELKEEMKETKTTPFSLTKVAVYGVLGMFLGVMVIAGYQIFLMLYGGKIYTAHTLEESYGLHVLGYVGNKEEKKCVFDKWINKLLGVNDKFSENNEASIIAAKINVLSKTKKVMAIGTIEAEKILKITNQLKAIVDEDGLELMSAGNPMYSLETMNRIKEYEIILVEKRDETSVKEMEKLLRLLHKIGATVIGVVLE